LVLAVQLLGGRSLYLKSTRRLLHWMVAINDSLTGADRKELVYCIACYLAPVRRIVGWTRSLTASAHPVHLCSLHVDTARVCTPPSRSTTPMCLDAKVHATLCEYEAIAACCMSHTKAVTSSCLQRAQARQCNHGTVLCILLLSAAAVC
jgi:hypothetical protein